MNITLSIEAVRQGRALAQSMNRPSFSNVVEFLIEQAHAKANPLRTSELSR